jgi:hypothetical protein
VSTFKDRNFKRVLALQLSANAGEDPELDDVLKRCGASDSDSDKIHRKVLALLDRREISASSLGGFRKFSMQAYLKGLGMVLPFWSGEGDPLPIRSFADLEQLPGLRGI